MEQEILHLILILSLTIHEDVIGGSFPYTTILGFVFIYETPKRKHAPDHLTIGVNEK